MFFNKRKDKEKVLVSLDILESYIQNNINSIDDSPEIKDSEFIEVEEKLHVIMDLLESKNERHLTVYGEIMLACEKIADGYINDKITSVSDDSKLNYIAKSLNVMFEKLNISVTNTLNILDEYKEQNYLHKVDTSMFLGGGLKELLEGINSLQERITAQATQSYKNGLILEEESQILTQKAEMLSASSQEQSVALEETAAAVVEITSIVQNNTQSVNQMQQLGLKVQEESNKGSLLSKDTHTAMDEIYDSTIKAYE